MAFRCERHCEKQSRPTWLCVPSSTLSSLYHVPCKRQLMYCRWSCWKNKPCIHYYISDELDRCIEDRITHELQAVLVTEIDYWPPELHSRTAVGAVASVMMICTAEMTTRVRYLVLWVFAWLLFLRSRLEPSKDKHQQQEPPTLSCNKSRSK